MEEPSSDFWQKHSLTYLEMAFRTDRQEKIDDPDGYGTRTGDCGDTVELYLKICDGIIEHVGYTLNGCLNTNACCNMVAELVEGKSTEDAWQVTPEAIAAPLETLPADHFHCAELVAGALYQALASANEFKQNPWKRLYQNR